MAAPVTYSFIDVKMSFVGPNGAFILGSDAGVAEEGITVEMTEEKSTMQIGADGSGMFSLHAGTSGRMTVRLLKNSPTNALLQGAYDGDTSDGSEYGQNTLVVSWLTQGDVLTGRQCGFTKFPTITYAKEGPMLEWMFSCVNINQLLGAGA
jgi:structural protein KPP10_ORF10